MNPALPLMAGILALIGLLMWQDARNEDKVNAFHNRCDAQGGMVLNSTKRNGGGWIGCYKGVTELPNEG